MEWLLGFALVCAIFAALGLGALIWMSVIKEWRDRDNW
jgi:hypothetical protein